MKNITVSVDEDTYHRARVKAAEDRTSVSAVVREALTVYAAKETEFERLARKEKALRKKVRAGFKAKDLSGKDTRNLTREEVHDRALIRRLQHPSV